MNRTPAFNDLCMLSRPQSPNSQTAGANYELTETPAMTSLLHNPILATSSSCTLSGIDEQSSRFTPERLLAEANRAIIESRSIVGDPLNQNLDAFLKSTEKPVQIGFL